jgi:hypothetical protein
MWEEVKKFRINERDSSTYATDLLILKQTEEPDQDKAYATRLRSYPDDRKDKAPQDHSGHYGMCRTSAFADYYSRLELYKGKEVAYDQMIRDLETEVEIGIT